MYAFKMHIVQLLFLPDVIINISQVFTYACNNQKCMEICSRLKLTNKRITIIGKSKLKVLKRSLINFNIKFY